MTLSINQETTPIATAAIKAGTKPLTFNPLTMFPANIGTKAAMIKWITAPMNPPNESPIRLNNTPKIIATVISMTRSFYIVHVLSSVKKLRLFRGRAMVITSSKISSNRTQHEDQPLSNCRACLAVPRPFPDL